jgi:hypothetical protein
MASFVEAEKMKMGKGCRGITPHNMQGLLYH